MAPYIRPLPWRSTDAARAGTVMWIGSGRMSHTSYAASALSWLRAAALSPVHNTARMSGARWHGNPMAEVIYKEAAAKLGKEWWKK